MAELWKKTISMLRRGGGASTVDEAAKAATAAPNGDKSDAYWQQVCSAREHYFGQHIGQLPKDILKLGHMFGVWPGGGLYVIPAEQVGSGVWAYATFGLTNADMPATATVSGVSTKTDGLGRVTTTEATLQPKAKAAVTAGSAGYGYELLVLARENSEWPLWILQWAVNAEIIGDAGILDRINKYKGLTIESVQVGANESVNLLIEKAREPLPTGCNLPNGRMELLVATVITDEEMRWSMEHGRAALLEKLIAAGVGQFSVRGRRSV